MNLLSYFYILTSFAFFESALAIFRLQRKSSLNRIAAFLLLWNAFYTLIRGLIPVAQTIIEAQTLASIMIVLLCFHGPIVFHFCAILAKLDPPPLRRILLVLLYTISLAVAIWDALPPVHRTYWDDAFCALTLICWVAGGGLIIGRLRIATDRTEKKQLRILGGFSLAGFVSTVFVALRSNVYPDRNNPSTEMLPDWLILLGLSAVCLLGLRVAMQKYNSLTLHPKTPSGQIFSAMNSPVVMADAEGRIRYANCEAAWILSAPREG